MTTYHGRACKYGHGTLRYVSSKGCITCAGETRNRLRRADMPKNRQQDRDRKRGAHRRDPRVKMFKTARRRAKEKGLSFNLTLADIIIPDRCPLLDLPIQVSDGILSPGSPSLDRILNQYGYVRGNVQVISHKANSLKSNVTSTELLALAFRLAAIEAFARTLLPTNQDLKT